MSIIYYGAQGPEIVIETEEEIAEAIDILHTQVMDNLGDTHPALGILERALDELQELAEGENNG